MKFWNLIWILLLTKTVFIVNLRNHSKTDKNLILFPHLLFSDFRLLYWQVCGMYFKPDHFLWFHLMIQRLRPHKAISPNRVLH